MKYEKSCGAIVIRHRGSQTEVLLIQHRNGGHWAFSKGHVEQGETEIETALREIREETALQVRLNTAFRESVVYSPAEGVEKEVVYFIGEADQTEVQTQEKEVLDYRWVSLCEAEGVLTYENDRNLIAKAKLFLESVKH